jgi:hypothetical protein
MKELIIHMGPGKCGSSSIQNFLQKNNLKNKYYFYHLLPPKVIQEISFGKIKKYIYFFKSILDKHKKIILSHECLSNAKHFNFIKFICKMAFENKFKIKIIGYSRKYSDYIHSSFNQWHFKNINLNLSCINFCKNNNINYKLFNGVEIYFIVGVLSNFKACGYTKDWFYLYNTIIDIVSDYNAKVIPFVIPSKKLKFCLINDFCKKANIKLNVKVKRSNKMWNEKFLESYRIAILNNILENNKKNNFFTYYSKKLNIKFPNDKNYDFLISLKSYTDSFYYNNSKNFCDKFNINLNYFEPDNFVSYDEIVKVINDEQTNRLKFINDNDEKKKINWLLKNIKKYKYN